MTQKEEIEMVRLYQFTLGVIGTHKKIIKPWKKKSDGLYDSGWNDCLKEVEKNHKKFVKYVEGLVKKYEGQS